MLAIFVFRSCIVWTTDMSDLSVGVARCTGVGLSRLGGTGRCARVVKKRSRFCKAAGMTVKKCLVASSDQ